MTPIKVAGNSNVKDRNIYHRINPLSPHVNVPYFPQRKDVIHSSITMNSSLDYENMYHNGMNFVLQNEARCFPQISLIDGVAVTNQSNQRVEGCVSQQARERFTLVTVERNGSVESNGKQLEHGSLDKLDETGRHETTEITAFHEHVDRYATTGNQNCTI